VEPWSVTALQPLGPRIDHSHASAALAAFYDAVVAETAALSFIEVVPTIFVRGSDSNAAARQCFPEKYLDFGIDAP
jgi:hypothetical protein